MSILTYKLKHNKNFATELKKAIQVAKYAISHKKCRSTKHVKHIGLKACISNQILRKYGGSKTVKNVHSVKLTINGYFVKVDQKKQTIKIPCLKLELPYQFPNNFTKINQVEVDNKYVYISVTTKDKKEIKVKNYIGIDRNTTGHCAVVGIPTTGKVIKLGKKAFHIHRKYKKIRKHLQIKNAKKKLKRMSKREKNIIKDINHKISRKIVEVARENNCGIKLEDLKGIRKGKKNRRKNNKKNKSGESFKSSINTWEFYQLAQMIEYKSKICGIPVVYIDPHYTSQTCSKCGLIGNRNKKKYSCPHCGHVDHADANASFNIALAFPEKTENSKSNGQSVVDRDAIERSTDARQLETQQALELVA